MNNDLLTALGLKEEQLEKINSETTGLQGIHETEYEIVRVKVIAAGSLGSKVIENYKEKKNENVTFIDMNVNAKEDLFNETELAVFIGQEDDSESIAHIENVIEAAKLKDTKTILLMSVTSCTNKEEISPEVQKLAERADVFIPVVDKVVQSYEGNVFSDIDKNALKEKLMQKYIEVILDFTPDTAGLIGPVEILEVISRHKGTAYAAAATTSGKGMAKEAGSLVLQNVYSIKDYQDSKVVIFNVTGDGSLGLLEINDIAEIIAEKVDENAEILFTASFDESMGDEVRVSVMGI